MILYSPPTRLHVHAKLQARALILHEQALAITRTYIYVPSVRVSLICTCERAHSSALVTRHAASHSNGAGTRRCTGTIPFQCFLLLYQWIQISKQG